MGPNGPGGPDDRFSQPRYSLLASRWVRLAWPEITARSTAVPARVVGAVSLELRARRRRRVAARVAAVACGSLAAAAAGIVAWTWVDQRQPVAVSGGSTAPSGATARVGATDEALWVRLAAAAPEREVVAGDTFRAGAGSDTPGGVRLASTDGTELVVEPGGVLQVVEAAATKRFTLLQGAVQVRVRKLRAGERFLIDTPEAEVEVHGTRFRVTRTDAATNAATAGSGPARCTGAAFTVVSVSEGIVSVASAGAETRLSPGGTWSSPCPASEAAAPVAVSAAVTSAAAEPRPRPDREHSRWLKRRHRDASPSPSPSPSQLAAQNDLFMAAARARKQGRPAQALDLFERFVETYPDSSLLESALVQRMRLLSKSGAPGAAAQAATRYLGQFPDGFARTEAEQALGGGGPPSPGPSVTSPNRGR